MGYAIAREMAAEDIPVIDISPLRDGSDPERVGQELRSASEHLGFIYIRGHGIPNVVIDAARSEAFSFFRGEPDQKASVRVTDKHRGWLGLGGAKMQDDAKADFKESFIWGWQDEQGETPEDHPLRGRNRWPASQPSLEHAAMAYFHHAHEVAHHLMRGFALGLGLPERFFLRSVERPLSRASFVYYPPQVPGSGADQFGVGPHTDFGVLTVLCQDNVGGLQVQDTGGNWIAAPPIDATLIVNVADLLARWTDGAFKSTPHRVVNSSALERLSLVLAFDPDPETIIDASEVFGPGHRSAHEPICCGDYLIWRFNKAFAYRTTS